MALRSGTRGVKGVGKRLKRAKIGPRGGRFEGQSRAIKGGSRRVMVGAHSGGDADVEHW